MEGITKNFTKILSVIYTTIKKEEVSKENILLSL